MNIIHCIYDNIIKHKLSSVFISEAVHQTGSHLH